MPDLYTATQEEILSDAYLYTLCTKELKRAGYRVACNCGKAQKIQNIENFIKNKDFIRNMAEKQKNRTILPKWHGLLYSSKLMKHINSEYITDESALSLIEQGLSRDLFDFSKYKGEIQEEEPKPEPITVKEPGEVEVSEDMKKEMIKGMKAEGLTNKQIAEKMNALGIKTSKGGTFFPINVNNYLK